MLESVTSTHLESSLLTPLITGESGQLDALYNFRPKARYLFDAGWAFTRQIIHPTRHAHYLDVICNTVSHTSPIRRDRKEPS